MERFLTDIKIECKYLTEGKVNPYLNSWLSEGQGLPSQIDAMLQKIFENSFIERSYKDWQNSTIYPAVCTFDMYSRVKDVERNFIGPDSTLRIKFLRGDTDCGGAYEGAVSGEYNQATGLLEKAKVNLDCYASSQVPWSVVQRLLKTSLAHELTHAFEDYNRRSMGGTSLGKVVGNRGYQGGKDKVDGVSEEMQWLAYILDPVEQKAFISQTVLEIQDGIKNLEKTGRLDRFEKIRNVDQVLQMTNFWPTYEYVRSFVEESQWDRLPKFKQDEFVQMYNRLVPGDVTSPSHRSITTYNQFVKKMKAKWYEFDNKLRTRVSQAVANALYDVSPKPEKKDYKISESFIYQAF